MTLDEFVRAFAAGPARKGGWYISTCGRLRRNLLRPECPITSMIEQETAMWEDVAQAIGLNSRDTVLVTHAADCREPHAAVQLLRKWLLEAVGLSDG